MTSEYIVIGSGEEVWCNYIERYVTETEAMSKAEAAWEQITANDMSDCASIKVAIVNGNFIEKIIKVFSAEVA